MCVGSGGIGLIPALRDRSPANHRWSTLGHPKRSDGLYEIKGLGAVRKTEERI